MASMKILPEHVALMRDAIAPFASAELFAQYQEQGLSHKRYRWDLLWKSQFNVCTMIYPYANDDHIDTALRFLVSDDGSIKGVSK